MADAQTPIALGGPTYDRAAERREDEEWLERAWADPATKVLPLAGSRLRASGEGVVWVSPAEAPAGIRVLLGTDEGVTRFAVIGDKDLAADDAWVGLRAVAPSLSAAEASYVVHAIGLAEWHFATRHCPRCGGRLRSRQAGHVLACEECGREQFPRTDPAVIMLVLDDEGRALLGRQPSWPPGRWSTLAGFVEPGESLEQAVRREVREEVGIEVGEVDYFGSQPWPLPASLMLGFVAHAETTSVAVDGDEIEEARWFSRDQAGAAAEAGELLIPPGISISRTLITHWYGGELPGSWR